MELSEAVSELKPAKEIIRILKEDLYEANSSEYNASTPSNLTNKKSKHISKQDPGIGTRY